MPQEVKYLEQCHHARLFLSSLCSLFFRKLELPARQALNTALKCEIVIA